MGGVPTMTLPKGWMWLEAVPTSSIGVDGMNITGPGSAFIPYLTFVTGNYVQLPAI